LRAYCHLGIISWPRYPIWREWRGRAFVYHDTVRVSSADIISIIRTGVR